MGSVSMISPTYTLLYLQYRLQAHVGLHWNRARNAGPPTSNENSPGSPGSGIFFAFLQVRERALASRLRSPKTHAHAAYSHVSQYVCPQVHAKIYLSLGDCYFCSPLPDIHMVDYHASSGVATICRAPMISLGGLQRFDSKISFDMVHVQVSGDPSLPSPPAQIDPMFPWSKHH